MRQKAANILSLAVRKYANLHIYGKILIWTVLLFYACLGVLILVVTPSGIAQFLYDQTAKLASTEFGWLALVVAFVIISFPPLIGHTTIVTLCGFAYGMNGFYIAAFGSLLGSALSFVCLRSLFEDKLRHWSATNEKWGALEKVVRAKGLPLIILIRVSPFPPWVYSNSLFASIGSVKLWQFVVATSCICPKLLLHVFIGSRIATFSDGGQREHMDPQTRIINAALIVGGLVLAITSSWWVYSLVQRQMRQLKGSDVNDLASGGIRDFDEEAPFLDSSLNV